MANFVNLKIESPAVWGGIDGRSCFPKTGPGRHLHISSIIRFFFF
jgi:hypothetical protein